MGRLRLEFCLAWGSIAALVLSTLPSSPTFAAETPTHPIATARSLSLQVSSIFLDDGREEVFVFPQRIGRSTELSAFAIEGGPTIAILGRERWRFAWTTQDQPGSGTHQSLLVARVAPNSRLGAGVGGSVSSAQSDLGSGKSEREFWRWHAVVGLGVSGSRRELEMSGGVEASRSRDDLRSSDDATEELLRRTLGEDDLRPFLQLRYVHLLSDARLALAGGYFDQHRTWRTEDRRPLQPVGGEVDGYGHIWYAALLAEMETAAEGTVRVQASYTADRQPGYAGLSDPVETRTEDRRTTVSASMERLLLRDLRGQISIGRSYVFRESEGGPGYQSAWSSSDAFAWGLEYSHRWVELRGRLAYDLGLDEPFTTIDVVVRP